MTRNDDTAGGIIGSGIDDLQTLVEKLDGVLDELDEHDLDIKLVVLIEDLERAASELEELADALGEGAGAPTV
jgi:hypothetical protein